ncbi:MAG: TetR/AcrR family transcriptional regulator [Lachnospiraceae bacterium]|nr:TetR/AcrR family transcriptional regulator [Lachnospiraceae bacterium]
MPPKARVTRQMVLDAAFNVVKSKGYENLSVRNVADHLKCSTQPILYNYDGVEELREEVYKVAIKYHSLYIVAKKNEDKNTLISLGLNHVRFGYKEKNLFRFIFQSNKFGDEEIKSFLNNPEYAGMVEILSSGLKMDIVEAKEMFFAYLCTAHGIASFVSNDSVEYEEARYLKILEDAFYGMLALKK